MRVDTGRFHSVTIDGTNGKVPIRVYFLGSGSLGVPGLRALIADPRICVAGVGTQPDRLAGRRRHPTPTLIGTEAAALGLAADKPVEVNATAFIERLRTLALDLVVVVAYGQILRDAMLGLARFGCLNVHASLLPRHRGAAPVAAAILAGDVATGVTFMRMDAGLDTGPIYETHHIPLHGRETASELEAHLAHLAAAHLANGIQRICHQGLVAAPQPDLGVSYARKLKKEDGLIDWTTSAPEIERRIRAMLPWPTAFALVQTGKRTRRLQVTAAAVKHPTTTCARPGETMQAENGTWIVACGTGALELLRVVPEGRTEMTAIEFLRGCTEPVVLRPACRQNDEKADIHSE